MDLIKIGKFIQERRKIKKLTQVQLAEKICVSEKTISKWECGNGFPDTSLMLPLCKELDISANELLSGKMLSDEEYKTSAEENFLEIANQIRYKDKLLLTLEWVLGWLSVVLLLVCAFVASFVDMHYVYRIVIILFGLINCLLGICFSIKIEKDAGYYECKKCHHKYVPTMKAVVWSVHVGRTRYMKCPKCEKSSWHKKVVNND